MKKILVVDDSMVARMYLSAILAELGHDVYEAKDGSDALVMLEGIKPDLMIIDLLMPGMPGFDLLVELKQRSVNIPVIVVSADIQEPTKEKCYRLGASSFVHKPVTIVDLCETVGTLLNHQV